MFYIYPLRNKGETRIMNLILKNNMDYFVFTGSSFFQQISQPVQGCDYDALYNEFSQTVFGLCTANENYYELLLTLIYTETELQHLCEHRLSHDADKGKEYAHKAFRLVRSTLELLKKQVPPLPSTFLPCNDTRTPGHALRWTGNAVDLVEIIYGLDEMGCINNGETPIGELASIFYSLFGVESKECYRFYTDIKHRKNESRTYFLDKMQKRLNERMRQDDERERQRR